MCLQSALANQEVGSTRVTSATLHLHVQAATNYTHHHRLGIITPVLLPVPTPKGWIAWLAKADCTLITIAQGYYTIESKGTRREMNPGCQVQDQLNTSEPTAPCITGRELNLRKLPGRQ